LSLTADNVFQVGLGAPSGLKLGSAPYFQFLLKRRDLPPTTTPFQ